MRVVLELLAPGVEHRQAAQLGAEMLGIAGNVQKRLRHATKKQRIEHLRIVKDEGREVLWQGKNPMDVGRLEDFILSSVKPGSLGSPVTFWAAAVATRVIRLLLVATQVELQAERLQLAVRAWELRSEGIAVFCQCEKGRTCPENHLVLRPANAAGIEKQVLAAIDAFRREYGVPSKKVTFSQRVAGHIVPQRRFTLQGEWKDDTVLDQAQEEFRRLL